MIFFLAFGEPILFVSVVLPVSSFSVVAVVDGLVTLIWFSCISLRGLIFSCVMVSTVSWGTSVDVAGCELADALSALSVARSSSLLSLLASPYSVSTALDLAPELGKSGKSVYKSWNAFSRS